MLRVIALILLLASSLFCQIYTQKDIEICEQKIQLALQSDVSDKPINEIIVLIGKSFLGTDYEAGTLESGEKEQLVIHLTGFDCYTLLESTLAFARMIKTGKTSFKDYEKEITLLRYREGKITDYTSRLHYFSDWIYDSQQKKIGKDITKEIGGVPYKNEVYFMSKNPNYYDRLKSNMSFVDEMKKIEKKISRRKYYYIPQDSIDNVADKIHSGDIIGITTNIGGLDIAHTGIAYKDKAGQLYFMHAPNVGKKVQITESTLFDYVKRNKKQTGIMVFRPCN